MRRIQRLPICKLAFALTLTLGASACGGGSESESSGNGKAPSSRTQSTPGAPTGPQGQTGEFTAGSATLTTPAGSATLDFSEGLYISANDSVVANFSDGDMTDPNTNAIGVSGSPAELSITLIGPLLRQGVATECTVSATKVEAAGFEGTFDCKEDVSGTFEAH